VLIVRIDEDRFLFDVPPGLRNLVFYLVDLLERGLEDDNPAFGRLFPTAYPDDPDKEAGFQALARSELIDTRHTAIETVRATGEQDEVDQETLDAWMRVVNDLRLVIGTQLDVSEDEDWRPPDSHQQSYTLYQWLSALLQTIVEAQTGSV
jgi:hypothetical protein